MSGFKNGAKVGQKRMAHKGFLLETGFTQLEVA